MKKANPDTVKALRMVEEHMRVERVEEALKAALGLLEGLRLPAKKAALRDSVVAEGREALRRP